MSIQLLYLLGYLIGFLSIIQLSEFLFYKYGLNSEITRKIAHILSSLASLTFLFSFKSHWYVFAIACVFSLFLFLSKQKGVYKSIDLIGRESIGSFIFPFSIYLVFLLFKFTNQLIYFVLPVLILGLSDSMASLVGMHVKRAKQIKILSFVLHKTYLGSLAFFCVTFIVAASVFRFCGDVRIDTFLVGLCFALTLTLVELFSNNGFDNITVPIATACLVWVFVS